MQVFKTNIRFNKIKNQNEVNCEGFFNSDFFTLIELQERQEEVYALYLKKDENHSKYALLYDALEHMRIALI